MRSKRAVRNTIANIVLQGIIFLSGIILPRFFLMEYGSSINGMVTSVNQFLAYLGLAEAGVGTASMVALYGPLALGDQRETNAILSATRRFYKRSGVLFGTLVAGFAFIYPYLITRQLDFEMVRLMILILASSTLVDYLFLGKYKVLLVADQKGYVIAYIQAAGTALNMVATIFLISRHMDVLIVKAIATLVYILRFFVVKLYVVRKYPRVDFGAKAKMESLDQRGSALLHQIVGAVVNNTDVVLLTICLGANSLIEVSVYGIYNMVSYAVNTMLTSLSDGLTAGFGEVISKKEENVLKHSFSNYEYIYMIILFCVFVCVGVLLVPFVMVYTLHVSDAEYIRPVSAMLFTVIVLLQNIRMPGLTIICAAGHFRETRHQAILEAVINIVVSLLLVRRWGINGVLAGTVCSYGYRSIEIILYNRRNLVKGSGMLTLKRISRNLIVSLAVMRCCYIFVPQHMYSFFSWILYALVTVGVAFASLLLVNYIREPGEFKLVIKRVKNLKG